jgi:hypothetical protein
MFGIHIDPMLLGVLAACVVSGVTLSFGLFAYLDRRGINIG